MPLSSSSGFYHTWKGDTNRFISYASVYPASPKNLNLAHYTYSIKYRLPHLSQFREVGSFVQGLGEVLLERMKRSSILYSIIISVCLSPHCPSTGHGIILYFFKHRITSTLDIHCAPFLRGRTIVLLQKVGEQGHDTSDAFSIGWKRFNQQLSMD